jgi:hypothetical protein
MWIQRSGSISQPIGTFEHFLLCRITAKRWSSVVARAFGRMRTAKPGRLWRSIVAFYSNKEKSVYRKPHWGITFFLRKQRLTLNEPNQVCLCRVRDTGRDRTLFQLQRSCGLHDPSQLFQDNWVNVIWRTSAIQFRNVYFCCWILKVNKHIHYYV